MDLWLPIETVLPLVFLVSLGFVLKKVRLLDNNTRISMNKIVYQIFLPAMLFYNLYKSDISHIFNGKAILYAPVFEIIEFSVLLVIVPRFVKDNNKRGVMIQGIFRTNSVLLGTPLVAGLCGAENIGLISLLCAIIIPLQNVESVILFEIFRGSKPNIKKIMLNICKNPLIISSLLGLLLKAGGITLPFVIDKFVSETAKMATPVSLLILGAFLNFGVAGKVVKLLTFNLVCRLIVSPAFFITGAVLLGFRGVELISLMALSFVPTAVAGFTMAEQMGGDADLAAHLVIFGTTFSPITIISWLYLAQGLNFI